MNKLVVVFLAATAAWGQSVYSGNGVSRGTAIYGAATTGGSGGAGDLYVAPLEMGGNDSNPCTLTLPCLSPQHATALVKGMPAGVHTVWFRGGTYWLNSAWTFASGDSGNGSTAIVYQNYGSEAPVISGGRKVSGGWAVDASTNCGANCTAYYLDVDANPADQGHFHNFESLYYNGMRRPRPQKQGGYHGYLKNACPNTNNATMCVAGANQAAADLACGCPDGPSSCTYQSTPCSGSTPWQCFNKWMYSGTDVDGTWHGIKLGDIEVLAFEKWAMGRARLDAAAGGVAMFKGPLSRSNGNSGCIPGNAYLVENVKEMAQKGQWYLDRCPGCASTATTAANTWRLYIYADTSVGENPNTAQIVVPGFDPSDPEILVANGLQYVTFSGLTFEHDSWMPNQYGLGDVQGMPAVSAALSFTGSSNIKLDGVTIAHVQGWALEWEGASTSNQVVNSALYDIGAGGIRVGHVAAASDTDAGVPSNILIQNTAVAYYGRIQPTGEGPGIWLGDTHDNTVTHNDVFGGYTGGVDLGHGLNRGANDGSTTTQYYMYNNWVTWNHIWGQGEGGLFNGVLSDFGGVYSAASLSAKCPTLGPPTLNPNTYCNHILYNRVHDLAHNYDTTSAQGSQCLYLDQGATATEVRFNLTYRCSHTGAFTNTPQSIGPNAMLSQYDLWDNNIFAEMGAQRSKAQRIVSKGGDNGNSITWTHNIGYFNSAVGATPQSSPGKWGCFADDDVTPVPCSQRFAFDYNLWWNAAPGNALTFSTCKDGNCAPYPVGFNLYSTMPWGPTGDEDAHSVSRDPQFLNPNYPVDDFHFRADLSDIGFTSWDYTQAGRTNPVIQVPYVADPYPMRAVDATTDYGVFPVH
ncbi:MAG: hypothetical protein H0X25_00180 [Acidobacteriales bacterium]|nr:hypothetical protein [Terriglobales bacterium]